MCDNSGACDGRFDRRLGVVVMPIGGRSQVVCSLCCVKTTVYTPQGTGTVKHSKHCNSNSRNWVPIRVIMTLYREAVPRSGKSPLSVVPWNGGAGTS